MGKDSPPIAGSLLHPREPQLAVAPRLGRLAAQVAEDGGEVSTFAWLR
jgi:hypothetical protein